MNIQNCLWKLKSYNQLLNDIMISMKINVVFKSNKKFQNLEYTKCTYLEFRKIEGGNEILHEYAVFKNEERVGVENEFTKILFTWWSI